MKQILFVVGALAIFAGLGSAAYFDWRGAAPVAGALSILTGQGGGTGIGTTTAGNIGNCLSVSSVTPLKYTFGACSGGGGGGSGNWFVPDTNFNAGVNSTSTTIWFTQGIQASSTSQFNILNAGTKTTDGYEQGGNYALVLSPSQSNVYVGTYNTTWPAGTNLINDTIVGFNAGPNTNTNTSKGGNVLVGNNVARSAASFMGSSTILGSFAGIAARGDGNVIIGAQAGNTLRTGANNILIGTAVDTPLNTTSQVLDIGNLLFGTGIYNGVAPSSAEVSGSIGIATSTPAATFAVQGNTLLSGDLFGANITATGTLTLSNLTGTKCLHEVGGVVSGTGSDCGSGTGSAGNWFTPSGTGYNGTSTAVGFLTGAFTSGSTTISSVGSGLVGANNGLLYGFSSSSLFGYTPLNPTRNINTTFPLSGGGDLSADRTLTSLFSTTSTWGMGSNGLIVVGNAGTPYVAASSTLSLPNTALQNSSVTVNTNAPLGGGGAVSLGGALTLTCATCSTSTFSFPWTPASNYNANTNSTTTPIWLRAIPNSLFASSTAFFEQINVGSTTIGAFGTSTFFGNLSVRGIATTSNLVVSLQRNGPLGTDQFGNVAASTTGLVTAGTGISLDSSVRQIFGGSLAITNSGVTSNVAGNGISVSSGTGAVTITDTYGYPFTPTSNYNTTMSATSTPIWLRGSLVSLAASSTSNFDQINVGSTTLGLMSTSTFSGNVAIAGLASTTNLILSALGPSAGSCLTTTSSGQVITTSCGGGGSGNWFTPQTWGNATGTLLGFQGGLISNASSTFSSSLLLTNTKNGPLGTDSLGLVSASTTGVVTAGTGISLDNTNRQIFGGSLAITNSGVTSIVAGNGISISGGTGAVTITDAYGFPFTPASNFNANANSTSTVLWFKAGVQGSSTSQFDSITISTTTATSTIAAPLLLGNAATNQSNLVLVGCGIAYPASVSVGGCVNIFSPAANLGPALEVNVSAGASAAGRGIVFNQTNLADAQDFIVASSSATGATTMNIKCQATGKGCLKLEYTGGSGNSNASALSIDMLNGIDTQGIFVKGAASSNLVKLLNIVDSSSGALASINSVGNVTSVFSSSTQESTFTLASTTNLIVSSAPACSGTQALTTNAAGQVSCGSITSGVGNWFVPATGWGTANSTSTLTGFTQGLFANASSTIGSGTQFGGLTVNGGATTTGNMAILSSLTIGTSTGALPNTNTGNLFLYANGISGTAPAIILGDESNTDTDFWMGLTTNNDGTNNDSFVLGSGLVPGTNPFFTLDYGSRAGIGTSTPYAKLSIHANPTDSVINTTLFAIGSSTASATTTLFSVLNTGNVGLGTSTPYANLSINAPAQTQPYFVVGSSTSEVFKVSPSPSAVVGIGTSTPFATLAVNPVAGGASNQFIVGSTTATNFQIDNSGHVYAPNTSSSGASQTGYWCYDTTGQLIRDSAVCLVSALKFKKDVQPIDFGLSTLMQMTPVTYYKKDPIDVSDSHKQIGFIADDVAKISPEANETLVTYDSNGDVHGFRYEQFTALLTKSIQELYTKFQALVAQVSGLEAKVQKQQAQIDHLQAEIDALKK